MKGEMAIKILVLDDEEEWLGKHSFQLLKHGYGLICTQFATDALKKVNEDTDKKIKAAIIDEILLNPRGSKIKQDFQGTDVLREINNMRKDIIRLVVSAAPENKGKRDSVIKGFDEEERLREVSDKVFHKYRLDKDYTLLIDYLKEQLSNRIYKEGDMYVITFEGSSANVVKNIKGMEHIAYLIKNQGKEVLCTTLLAVKDSAPDPIYSKMTHEQLEDEGLKIQSGNRHALLDKRTKADLRNEIEKERNRKNQLNSDLDKARREYAPSIEIEEIEKELEEVAEKIKSLLYIYKHRKKCFVDQGQKNAKDAVEKAIKRTLNEIKDQHQELYNHLHDCLKIDLSSNKYSCSYSPPDFIEWEVD